MHHHSPGRHHPRPRRRALLPRLLCAPFALILLAAEPGGSGETIPLDGQRSGARLDVTLTRVVDPAVPATDGTGTGAERLVSVTLRLENTGTVPYEDSPAPATHLLDTDGRRFTGTDEPTPAGAGFPAPLVLAPGDSADGSVTFRLPSDARPAAVQFALDAGLADDVGHWGLP
ncbi:hypothetical protein [Streptomyces sp. Isolate_45]|uniref:hypothetical protein n=1 Tax=Streptomyces sp. Isolate_45 TaxID=2950111 RepID=UPI002481A5E8|nr:hypothetical protein [Streptomyces sp. Isolate_45]MDA5280769.1 hypothetical protein [Streptomyces sp. Isolate_45]